MPTLFRDLIRKTILKLSMYPGTTGSQIYAEDRIANMLQEKFNFVWDEMQWPDYTRWNEYTLDGTLGITTLPVEGLTRFEDIISVFAQDSNYPLKRFHMQTPPGRYDGNQPRWYMRYPVGTSVDRILRVVPYKATGTISVNYKAKPTSFGPDDMVYMDEDLLILGAAYDYAEDDGSNPGQIEKFQIAFETRLKQLKREDAMKPLDIDPRISDYPTGWYDYGGPM